MVTVTTHGGPAMGTDADQLRTAEAAALLNVKPVTVRAYVAEGWLVPITRSGLRGPGRRSWFDRGEVEAFKAGGAPAAEAYRKAKAKRRAKA